MQHRANPVTCLFAVAGIGLSLALQGCGSDGSAPPGNNPPPAATGLLRKVRTPAELEALVKAGVRAAPSAGIATDSLAAAGNNSFSGTYTQEANIDELDAVRYDGTTMYIAPQRVVRCCFVSPLASSSGGDSTSSARAIRILRTDPVNARASQIATIPLEQGESVQGLYVTGNRAFALTSEAFFGAFGNFWTGLPFWAPTDFGFRVFDVSNPADPRPVFNAKMDGVYVESRRVGDNIYLISRYTPTVLLDPARRTQLDSISLNELLPQITINGAKRPLVDAAQCYVTNQEVPSGYPVMTTITVIPIQNPQALSSICYNEATVGVYMSERAIYLAQQVEPSIPATTAPQTLTRIHKFSIAGATPSYVGSAEIVGAVWSGGQNDFRMNELNDQLRVMTTEFTLDPTDSTDLRLYVLRQKVNEPSLEVVSQLPNAQRPEEIGKPSESLYGVRFVGNRLYAVTFRRIDPLYVIDLANPSDPRIAGQLELPGFSDFLHPVTDSLLLGLGQGDTGQIKLELFDVSVLNQPASRGAISLGGRSSFSEARYDRHAFTYLANTSVDRFTIPAVIYADNGSLTSSGLQLFEIRGKQTPTAATLQHVGAITPRAADGQTSLLPVMRNRAFIHGDAVYYVADERVWSAWWQTPTLINGPF
jgi:uncharacterized secreted protein with C-terminal beta-propeller domain